MATSGNPIVSCRISKSNRAALSAIVEIDAIDVAGFVNRSVTAAIEKRLLQLTHGQREVDRR